MVKIFKISSLILFLTSVIFVTSCNKQDAALNAPITVDVTQTQLKLSNVKLENGMLVFNTKADFEKARYVVQNGQETVSEWLYTQFPSFNSQVKALKALNHQDSLNILN